jgi:two-component system, NarL family, sensor histidine kinase DesK
VVPVAGLAAMSVAQLLRSNAALADARESLARLAVQEERARFSRDLHDVLGHALSLVGVKVQLARRLMGVSQREADFELHEVEGLIRDALDATPEVAGGYRRPTIAGQLSGARAALAAAGIRLTIEGEAPLLAPGVEGAIAWVIREGATNVIRHSQARSCRIAFGRQRQAAVVEIVDDGRGPGDDASPGLGLHSLEERLKPFGGTVRWGAGTGGGYVLWAEVPSAPETLP